MGNRLLTILIGLMFLTACNNDVPVIELAGGREQEAGGTRRPSDMDLMKTNQMIAQKEATEIESFARRRHWEMTDIGSGIRVMKRAEGDGPVAECNDTAIIRYTVRNIEDKIVYADMTDTVVVCRLQPNRGLDLALRSLNEGSRATVILPSEEAYGVPGDGDRIGKRWILIYDLEVVRVKR